MRVDSLEPLKVLTNKIRSSKVCWWSADNRNALSNRRFDENLTEKYLWCRLTICIPLKLISPLPISARGFASCRSMQDSRCLQGWTDSSSRYDISLRQTLPTPAVIEFLCDRQLLLRSISNWTGNITTFGELQGQLEQLALAGMRVYRQPRKDIAAVIQRKDLLARLLP